MNELKKTIEKEIAKIKNQIPKGDGTALGLTKRMSFVTENSDKAKNIIDGLAKTYVADNNLSESESKKVSELSTEYYLDFMKSFS